MQFFLMVFPPKNKDIYLLSLIWKNPCTIFGSKKILNKEKNIVKKYVFSYLILLWKILKEFKYN